jgi:hypothetical protein
MVTIGQLQCLQIAATRGAAFARRIGNEKAAALYEQAAERAGWAMEAHYEVIRRGEIADDTPTDDQTRVQE